MSAPSSNSPRAAQRRKARHYAMQALYQWHMAGASAHDIEAEFRADNDMTHVDQEYFHELLSQSSARANTLDELIQPTLHNKTLKELDPVSLSLLRMAVYELQHRIDVPYKVVINEAVALAKKFGPTDAHKFINATLDKLAASLRAHEFKTEMGARP